MSKETMDLRCAPRFSGGRVGWHPPRFVGIPWGGGCPGGPKKCGVKKIRRHFRKMKRVRRYPARGKEEGKGRPPLGGPLRGLTTFKRSLLRIPTEHHAAFLEQRPHTNWREIGHKICTKKILKSRSNGVVDGRFLEGSATGVTEIVAGSAPVSSGMSVVWKTVKTTDLKMPLQSPATLNLNRTTGQWKYRGENVRSIRFFCDCEQINKWSILDSNRWVMIHTQKIKRRWWISAMKITSRVKWNLTL